MISSTSSTSGGRLGERAAPGDELAEPLAAAGSRLATRVDRPAGPAQRDAERRPDRARPDDPDDRRLAAPRSGRGDAGGRGRGPRRRGGAGRAAPGRGRSRGLDRLDRSRRALARLAVGRLGRARPAPVLAPGLHRPPAPSRDRPPSRYSSTRRVYRPQRRRTRADSQPDPFGARASLGPGLPDHYRLDVARPIGSTSRRAPVTLKILLENVLRHAGGGIVRPEDVETLAAWRPGVAAEAEVPFMPARVILQDFTGVPAIVDLAVMRDAMADLGGDPARVNPLVPADLVIDHSVQVDRFGTSGGVRLQRRARVRAQRRALPAAALGPDRVPRPAGRAARDRASSTRSTSSSSRRSSTDAATRRRRRPDRLPGHARRDRLPHDDDQRPRRPRLRRRRDRGRGRAARPAALPADAADRRRPAARRAAARLDRDRPRPRRDRDAALVRRRRRVRRVRRRRARQPVARRPGDDQQHEPGVRGDRRRSSRSTTRRSPTCA